jgi:hypothetical protein
MIISIFRALWRRRSGATTGKVPVSVSALLFSITRRRRYLDEAVRIADAAMSYYAERMWGTRRDPETGLFDFGADAEATGRTQMIEQAAMVQIFAVLAWPRAEYRLLY